VHPSLLEQVLEEGFHVVAAHRPHRPDAACEEVIQGEYVDDYLTTTEKLVRVLGLSKLPHFTSLDKFLLRVPGVLLERVLGGFIRLTRIRMQVFSPDSSGFSPHHASHYYALRIKRDILSSMRKQVKQKERSERR
jgi:hypothetical protein